MDSEAEIFIYCNYEQPGGVERVSLRLREFLHRIDRDTELVSLFGDPIFEERSSAVRTTPLEGRTLVFSRKGDLREMGRAWTKARLIYWRHVPVTQLGWRRWVDILFIAWMSRRAQVVCVCDELAAEICELPFVDEDRVATCYSPVGSDLPETVDIRLPDGAVRELVYFGRLGDQKRLDLVIWQVMEARRLGADVRLTIYGYDDVVVDPVPEGVSFAGSVQDPHEVLRAADAVILISEYEGFPTVMVEAALTGTPIICNDFSTGRLDFERLVGPVVQIDPEDNTALYHALDGVVAGAYDLEALSDEQIAHDWLGVLNRVNGL